MMFKILLSIPIAMTASCALAQPAQWAHQSGKVSADGSITVKSLKTPGGTATASKNPSGLAGGTAVDLRQNAATQPPLLIKKGGKNAWSLYYEDRAEGLQ